MLKFLAPSYSSHIESHVLLTPHDQEQMANKNLYYTILVCAVSWFYVCCLREKKKIQLAEVREQGELGRTWDDKQYTI